MAKKQKRSITTRPGAVETVVKATVAAPSRTSAAEFNPDYSYVVKDLKRIGVLAGSFFVLLIALSIFLR